MPAAASSWRPSARAVVDIGALNGRAIYVDERGKVLSYKMTSQCASGSGQFLENIARYLGVAVEEIGPLSQSSKNPEKCSSICAVLAETDVINMVSRGIATPDVLKGIHLSMASRIVKLLKVTGIKSGVGAAHRWPGARQRAAGRDPGRDGHREGRRDGDQPRRLDLRRRDRRGAVGRLPPRTPGCSCRNRRPPDDPSFAQGDNDHGPAHQRRLHRLRRLQAGLPERGDQRRLARST